ncbi:unnamed protein product [Hyaloperonospora brassicae]|uniref:COMM domain-containing protein n=1 Tax=Hyaloperonospora brassicae TaxID=162125 RepID=A0AAV0SWD3_HYABA|nr:unnamed protein product [Hyaloperonospora brassicae]
MCRALGANIHLQAVVALLRFILTHAAKYNVERTDLVEELLQLGTQLAVAEVVALSYEQLRPRIQDQLHAQRFRFPGIAKMKWKVEAESKVSMDLVLDQSIVECDVATPSATTAAASSELSFDMSEAKFLALYEELSEAQSMLRSV